MSTVSQMTKKMLVSCDPHETRIAVLDEDRLTEIFIERHHQLGVVGNIYQGRVKRVLPGMQAAFVDIGPERDTFLYVSEVTDPLANLEFDGDDDEEEEEEGVAVNRRMVESALRIAVAGTRNATYPAAPGIPAAYRNPNCRSSCFVR